MPSALPASYRLDVPTPAALKRWAPNLLLLLVATGMALLVTESILASVGTTRLARKSGPTDSTRDIVLRLRSGGRYAVPRVPGNVLVDTGQRFMADDSTWLYPIGPAPGRATVVLCADGPTEVTYEADRFGFNNPDAIWDAGPAELAILGDSYTAGVCVRREDQIPTLLNEVRPTVNLGMSGAGPLRELAILREYARLLTPRVVAWVYYEGNDLWDLSGETTRSWLTGYLEPDGVQELASRQRALDAPYEQWVDSIFVADPASATAPASARDVVRFLTGLPRLERLRDLLHVGELFPDDEPDLGLLPDVLGVARAEIESWGGRMLLVYMPDLARYDTWIGSGPRGREDLLELARAEDIATLDLDIEFREHGDPQALWSRSTAHLNEEGYRIAAEAISYAVDSLMTTPPPESL